METCGLPFVVDQVWQGEGASFGNHKMSQNGGQDNDFTFPRAGSWCEPMKLAVNCRTTHTLVMTLMGSVSVKAQTNSIPLWRNLQDRSALRVPVEVLLV